MREPKIGEILACGICFGDCKPIDEEWIEYFNNLSDKDKKGVYDEEEDRFLSYDGCEDDTGDY